MRSLRVVLVAATTLFSVTQIIWMAAFVALAVDNLRVYGAWDVDRWLLYGAWWNGLVSAFRFARRALAATTPQRPTGGQWIGIGVGIGGSVLLEAQLSDPVFNFPYGYFETGIAVWLSLGFAARKLPLVRRSSSGRTW
jgi:hypothetical protein